MRPRIALLLPVCLASVLATAAERGLAPVESVRIQTNRAILLNGRPFFPIMAWLQDPKNFAAAKACGMNTTAGYWPKSGGTRDVREYIDLVHKAGLYGVMPFDAGLKGHPALLGYIHGDEPDLPHRVSDAVVVPAKSLRANRRAPLWKLVDGGTRSWSVLDPLEGASLTIKLKEPVTVESLAVWLTVSKGLSMPNEIAFDADGREILRTPVEAKRGRQQFALPAPATFRALRLRIVGVTPGKNVWGSLAEIEGFDRDGRNVLLSPPRMVPRTAPDATQEEYRAIKAADPSRPVFMTFTGNFHPFFKKWPDKQRATLYPAYIRAADVVGYDIYPIYGWNKPQWIHLVYEATALLTQMAGPRPVYAWIETSKGGQWTGPLSRQKDVTPQHIRAEVWMGICGGATAIGYFTHVWKPRYSQFGVPQANRDALSRINSQITRLTPAILGQPAERRVAATTDSGAKIAVLAKRAGGAMYVFAVNYDEKYKKAAATLKVEGLDAGVEVAVVDEGRTIRSNAGSFADEFGPLAVHIYRLPE